jgi:hypothetical protein
MKEVLVIITDKIHTRKERSVHKSNEVDFTVNSRHVSRAMISVAFEWTYMPHVRK